jgi:hypothetical protein
MHNAVSLKLDDKAMEYLASIFPATGHPRALRPVTGTCSQTSAGQDQRARSAAPRAADEDVGRKACAHVVR